eukprot:13262012-Alexandrium_andersonii.AAC.1
MPSPAQGRELGLRHGAGFVGSFGEWRRQAVSNAGCPFGSAVALNKGAPCRGASPARCCIC